MRPGEYPEGKRRSKLVQDGYYMAACVVFHKRLKIVKHEFLAIGKKNPFRTIRDGWFRFEYHERGQVQPHGIVWCQSDSIPDAAIYATVPLENDGYVPEFPAYLQSLYKDVPPCKEELDNGGAPDAARARRAQRAVI